jgi:AAA domain
VCNAEKLSHHSGYHASVSAYIPLMLLCTGCHKQESDIKVASLVRCNDSGVVGFMQERERVNVLLSRARYGMILIGSAATLTHSPQWQRVLSELHSTNNVITGLPAVCQQHPADGVKLLDTLDDFSNVVSDGGCDRACGKELSCKHVCQLRYAYIHTQSKLCLVHIGLLATARLHCAES